MKFINWVKFDLSLSRCYLTMDGLLAIIINLGYISNSGKKPSHLDAFWSDSASYMKHGLIIFDKYQSIPNRKLISYIIKELLGWQRKAA